MMNHWLKYTTFEKCQVSGNPEYLVRTDCLRVSVVVAANKLKAPLIWKKVKLDHLNSLQTGFCFAACKREEESLQEAAARAEPSVTDRRDLTSKKRRTGDSAFKRGRAALVGARVATQRTTFVWRRVFIDPLGGARETVRGQNWRTKHKCGFPFKHVFCVLANRATGFG